MMLKNNHSPYSMFARGILSSGSRINVQFGRRYARVSPKSISNLKRKTKRGTSDFTSRDNVLHKDIGTFLGSAKLSLDEVRIPEYLIHKFLYAKEREIVKIEGVQIISLTSEGEGLGLVSRNQYDEQCTDPNAKIIVKLPKAVPGDVAAIFLKRHHDYYAEAELIGLEKEAKLGLRNNHLTVCKHFDLCSGCQLQMMPYEKQLEFKQDIIKRAYKYFYPELDHGILDGFGLVVDSPMQYSYRTKLTPHTFIPKKFGADFLPVPIGFNHAIQGNPTVDIDHCPIATNPINTMLPILKNNLNTDLAKKLENNEKAKVASDFILRDSLRIDHSTGEYTNVCLVQRHNVVTEKVNDFVFQFEANEFFQNNRFILPTFIDFLEFHLSLVNFKHLVDAYCGSGFLGISLSNQLPEGGKVFGIEISKKSIEYAKHNAGINGIPVPEKMEFVSGNTDSMFENEQFINSGVTGEDCVVLMNPSRKGSTDVFLKQLVEFKPKAIVYVSCNVFTQARDLASLQKFSERLNIRYRLKTVTGFDFYPQTKHVESVAVLELDET